MAVRVDYREFPSLEAIYLEDSFVLDIQAGQNSVIFLLDAVLTEKHAAYSPPLPGEQYCYQKTRLIFPNTTYVRWVEKNMRPITDATGEADYGNIDTLFLESHHYHMTGEWGELDIVSSPPFTESLT